MVGDKRILFFIPSQNMCGNGVLQSQVLGQARFLLRQGAQCLVVTSEAEVEAAEETQSLIRDGWGVPACVSCSTSRGIPFFAKHQLAKRIYREHQQRITRFHPTHIYTRSAIDFGVAAHIAREQGSVDIYDARGAVAAEAALTRGRRDHYFLALAWIQRRAMRNASRLACVSHRFADWIKSKTGRDDCVVIPCCVSEDAASPENRARTEMRKRLGYGEENKVICYTGSLARWQNIPSILGLLRRLSEIRPEYRFLFITRQTESLQARIRDAGLPPSKCFLQACDQQEVATYLAAGDAGILMRDDTLVNNVAAPTKVGEYLNAGLPILLTSGIGDMSELVCRENVGTIIPDDETRVNRVVNFVDTIDHEAMLKRCRRFVKQYLSWDAYLGEFARLYA